MLLFAHHQNRAVSVSNDRVGDTPHERSSYSAATPAAYYYQTRSYFLGKPNDFLVFSPPPKIGFLHASPLLLDLAHLVV